MFIAAIRFAANYTVIVLGVIAPLSYGQESGSKDTFTLGVVPQQPELTVAGGWCWRKVQQALIGLSESETGRSLLTGLGMKALHSASDQEFDVIRQLDWTGLPGTLDL